MEKSIELKTFSEQKTTHQYLKMNSKAKIEKKKFFNTKSEDIGSLQTSSECLLGKN